MAFDQNDREKTSQKEVANQTTANGSINGQTVNNADRGSDFDTEFAADSWMGAVLNPEAARPSGNQACTGKQQANDQADEPDTPVDQSAEVATHPAYQAPTSLLGVPVAMDQTDDTAKEKETKYEMGSEFTPTVGPINAPRNEERDDLRSADGGDTETDSAGSTMGMVGIGLSILSLFLLPYLLAPAGIIVGYLAFRRNARTTGTWAMVIGALAILGAVLIYPYYRAH
ncbi:hypothetical protein ACI7RC_20310 [Brevibacillus sp. B_LB10_24]|uniref:hypothetical protein n=1 Tax=Brevibacillus sp. B_LB10_24 TaxID=3380645 RepID=UPI0038BBE3AB